LGGSVLVGEPGGVDLDRLGTGGLDSEDVEAALSELALSELASSVLGVAGSWAFTPEARGIRAQNSFR